MTLSEGHHLEYIRLIRKVAAEVSREFTAPAGYRGHGYEVASTDDIEQRVHLKLLEGGFDDAYFDALDDPQASIRLFARNAAQREVETRHRKHDGKGLGYRESSLSPLVGQDTHREVRNETPITRARSVDSLPLVEVLREEFEARLMDLADDLLSKVPERYRETVTRYYLFGEDLETVAAHVAAPYEATGKKLQRGRKALHPDEEASLRALRAYWHPEAKTPGRIKATGTATALLDLLAT